MYVEQIESLRARTKMKKPGFIRRKETIDNLREKGVIYVYIDADQITLTKISNTAKPKSASTLPSAETMNSPPPKNSSINPKSSSVSCSTTSMKTSR